MMDLTKHNFNQEQLNLINEIERAVEIRLEMYFVYNEKDYHIDYDYDNNKIMVFEEIDGTEFFYFDCLDDFFTHFLLDGKPFIERFKDLTSFDIC